MVNLIYMDAEIVEGMVNPTYGRSRLFLMGTLG